jgi:Ca2+-binding EF-hand superfamily protein
MVGRTKRVWITLAITVLVATGSLLGHAAAQKVSVPKSQDKLALGEEDVKQLLLLMDTDRHGKVSRQEYMKFMEAEFNRLDKDKTGELDVKTLTQSNLTVSRFVGK